jgi:hypothetical protein
VVIFPEQARKAVGYALEEAEFFDGLSRADAQRYAQAFDAMPDTLLVSLARQLLTVKMETMR